MEDVTIFRLTTDNFIATNELLLAYEADVGSLFVRLNAEIADSELCIAICFN